MIRSTILAFSIVVGAIAALPAIAQDTPTASSANAQKVTLTVSISGLRNDKGQVMIELWNQSDGFPTKDNKGFKGINIDANKAVHGTVTVTFEVTPGIYAVSSLHDENKNNKMDTNALGIPKEGYCASNNVVTHLHAPSFEQAKFQVPATGAKINVIMSY